MRKILNKLHLVVLLCVCAILGSCSKDDIMPGSNDSRFVGEWYPVKYTNISSDVITTDVDEIEDYWYKGWLMFRNNSFRSATALFHGTYVSKDDNLNLYYDGFGGRYVDEYEIISYSDTECTIIDTDGYFEMITLRKFEECSVDTYDIKGKWEAKKIIGYYDNGNAFSGDRERLNGFDKIHITDTDITLMGKNMKCPYYIKDNNLHPTPSLDEFSFKTAHVKKVTDKYLYMHYTSLDGKCQIYVTYYSLDEY